MASEYLRKSIADRRTGANLIGISVDTSNMRDLSSDFEMAFNQLEKFARETDELKINNERTRLKLEIANNRIAFKEKYLSDPSVYASQEKWDETSRLYEQERINAKKLIAESKYLSKDEKSLWAKDMDLDFRKDWLDPMNKRNGVVVQERVNEAMTNIDMITSIASMGDIYDTNIINRAVRDIKSEYKNLINLGVQTENDMNYALAQKIPLIEGSLLLKKINQEIIDNEKYATAKDKILKTNEVIEAFKDSKRLEEISKQYGFEDGNNKKYFELKTSEVYDGLKKSIEKNIYNIEKSKERLSNQRKAINSNEKKVRLAINNNDTYKLTEFKTGINYNAKNMIDDEENIETLYGKENDIEYFGDVNSCGIAKVLNNVALKEIKETKSMLDKTNPDKDINLLTAIYSYADKISSGDTKKRNMVIKDAARQEGIDITIALKYENNPEYLTVGRYLKKGKNINLGIEPIDEDYTKGIKEVFDWRSEDEYLELFNELGGDEKAYEVLNQYISGFIASEAEQYKRVLNYMPVSAFETILKDKEMFKKLKENLGIVKELAISPINYEYANIKGENYGVEELIFNTEPIEQEVSDEDEYYSFGG